MKIGLISDIHEDLKSLERALEVLGKKKCDEIVCMGDITGFSIPHYKYQNRRNASECLRLIKENCSLIIPGNHDLHACLKTPYSNPGFNYPPDWYEMDFIARIKLAGGRVWLYEDTELESNLSDQDKNFIRGLPEYIIQTRESRNILFSHFLYPDLTGSSTKMLPDSGLLKSHFGFMLQQKCGLSFFGHSHVEGLWVLTSDKVTNYRTVNINNIKLPLAIGLPCIANGRNDPGVAIFDTLTGIIESHRLFRIHSRYFNI